jgi:hypothetical protein
MFHRRLNLLLIPLIAIAPINLAKAAPAMDSEDLYRLCSSFPHNSQCKGYEAPIALDQRSGKSGGCVIKTIQMEYKGACKVAMDSDNITIYQEYGDGLSVLKNDKATKSFKIPNSSVNAIQYREGKRSNTGAAVVNTLIFGLPGLLLTPKKKYAEISTQHAAIELAGSNLESTLLVFDRDTGLEMRFQLEKNTGKTVELPEKEQK